MPARFGLALLQSVITRGRCDVITTRRRLIDTHFDLLLSEPVNAVLVFRAFIADETRHWGLASYLQSGSLKGNGP